MTSSSLLSDTTPSPPSRAKPQIDARWSARLRIVFRFAFCFLMLCIFPFPFSTSPGSVIKTGFYDRLLFRISSWAGTHLLHVAPSPGWVNGFALADANVGYVSLLLLVVVALAATIIWTIADQRRSNYRTLNEWLRLYVRYSLACTMFAYGMDKVFALQFSWSLPGPQRLAEPLGNYSRFALMWTFMGYSTGYTIFAGAGEVIGGTFLFFRRTTTLGALIVCGVMANVVALNFFYGVPVKLFSSLLLLEAIFLVIPDADRLLRFFVFDKPTHPTTMNGPFSTEWLKRPRLVTNAVILALALYWFAGPGLKPNRERANPPKSPIYGLYQVESFTQDGKSITPTDSSWRRVIFEDKDSMTVLTIDDSMATFEIKYDEPKNSFSISNKYDYATNKEQPQTGRLTYGTADISHVELHGNLDTRPIVVELRKIDLSKFTLISHGFYWSENGGYYR